MKKHYLLLLFTAAYVGLIAQTPFQRVYSTLNTKCQNGACHSATASDGSESLKFDGTIDAVHAAIFKVPSTNASSLAKHELLAKPQHPYYSFLLRKIAGASFDTDLAIDTATEGSLMLDINGQQLTNKEIEFIRQWIAFGAKKTYSGSEPQPNYQLVSDFYDELTATGINRFIAKPAKPAPGTGIQLRMGPIFLPITGEIEQEYLQQQEVNFPYLPEVTKIEGIMNQQSHHFLLFKFDDTTAAQNSNAADKTNMAKVTLLGITSFDGDKSLTASWQNDAELVLPEGTGLFWEQKTVLDMNYHIKNFSATFVLPTDFYFNVYFKPRSPSTIEMKSQLSQNIAGLIIAPGQHTMTYDDPVNNGTKHTRYLWMTAGHTHEWGTTFDLYQRDTLGNLGTAKVYDGGGLETNNGSFYDYSTGTWDWHHPPIEYWPNLLPIKFGKYGNKKAGLVSVANYNNTTGSFLTFSTQTDGEMQLWYYMYTLQPLTTVNSINNPSEKGLYFEVMPNPMNNTGKLVYNLEEDAVVESYITDLTGKAVAHLSKESQSEGTHEISITDQNLSAGIYFASLNINGTVYTKKFIIAE
ncbi:MAG: T9SS type A sorting domain-containing protein [Chitinophagales bacterium]